MDMLERQMVRSDCIVSFTLLVMCIKGVDLECAHIMSHDSFLMENYLCTFLINIPNAHM